MDVTKLDWEQFRKVDAPIIDVRSPGEHASGHIPTAINFPLLSNEERVIVGTLYKQTSSHAALIEGLRLASGKFAAFVERARSIAKDDKLKIYCWRGGMRSSFMAHLFSLAKIKVSLLDGGYKAFRKAALASFASNLKLQVVGGYTGSGKTEFLLNLNKKGEQVIDLEGLAHHKGSTYGRIGEISPQPSVEHFENKIADLLFTFDLNKPIWIEDESRVIGNCKIPDALFAQMRKAPLSILKASKEERVKRLEQIYLNDGYLPLIAPTRKLEKRLGNERMQKALRLLEANDPFFFSLILDYYDKAYDEMMKRRRNKEQRELKLLNLAPHS